MPNTESRALRFTLIGITALLLAVILILIGSIHGFEFLPGRALEYTTMLSGGSDSNEATGWRAFTVLMRVLITIAVVVVIFQIIFKRAFRWYYLTLILLFGGILLATEFVGCNRLPPEELAEHTTEEMMEPPEVEIVEAEREVMATSSQYVILAIILSSVIVLAAGLYLRKWLHRRPQEADGIHDEILESLANAAHRIRAGEDAYTVVLFCYQEMIRILSTAGRIDATYLTPREFERRLASAGLAGSAITQLTDMFELVRYARRIDDAFGARALTCLDAIQEAHATFEQ